MTVASHDETATEPPATQSAESPGAPADACLHCGARLADDQEWCIECGTARTIIRSAPSWRFPVAVVAGVFALVLAGLAVALIKLSSDANRVADTKIASATVTVSTPAPAVAPPVTPPPAAPRATVTHAAAKPSAAATTTATKTVTVTVTRPNSAASTTTTAKTRNIQLADWPPGLGGWTVVLSWSKSRATAEDTARRLAETFPGIGVLNTSDHPSMAPGVYVVFSGRYPTKDAATAAATQLQAEGQPTPHARMVEPPGGN
jgi:septal ring-binding cell division protein DamX